MKAPAILLPNEPLPDLREAPIHMESYQKGFREGFQDGVAADCLHRGHAPRLARGEHPVPAFSG